VPELTFAREDAEVTATDFLAPDDKETVAFIHEKADKSTLMHFDVGIVTSVSQQVEFSVRSERRHDANFSNAVTCNDSATS